MKHDQSDDARVLVRGEGLKVHDATSDVGTDLAHRRFGGIDVPASLTGALVAIGLFGIVGGLIGAGIGGISYQTGVTANDGSELGIAAVAGALVALFIAFLLGGWAAGRIARYDGARNGIMVVVWVLLLGVIFAALGATVGSKYDVFEGFNLPRIPGVDGDDLAMGAVIGAIVAFVVMLLGAVVGGRWGTRFHARADALIVGSRNRGITTPRTTTTRGGIRHEG